jgi:hypothetical protein
MHLRLRSDSISEVIPGSSANERLAMYSEDKVCRLHTRNRRIRMRRAAQSIIAARMPLDSGTKLGPYETQSSLGAVNAGIDCG